MTWNDKPLTFRDFMNTEEKIVDEVQAMTTQPNVIEWAGEHDLLKKTREQCLKQWGKTVEEVGEFLDVVKHFDRLCSERRVESSTLAKYAGESLSLNSEERHVFENIRLEAGDILVTLAIQLHIHGFSLDLDRPMKALGDLDAIMEDISSRLKEYAPLTPNVEIHISRLVGWLKEWTEPYGLSLDECLDAAYEKIKDREGQTIDGVFVKA